jgi:hypothetical protein
MIALQWVKYKSRFKQEMAMSSERLRIIMMQIFRTALWLNVIQTVLWLVHGVRDGTFVAWSTHELGPVGDISGLWTLTILFTVLALLPLVIAITDHAAVRWGVFILSLAYVYLSAQDWVGWQSPTPYQKILKVAHGTVGLSGVWFAWKWARLGGLRLRYAPAS